MKEEKQWSKELKELSRIISKSGLEKTIKWGADVFTYEGKNLISYGGFKKFFAIWFYNGVFLKDKYKVLINAQESKTKSMRQWRMTTYEEINEKRILEYLNEAVLTAKKGLNIKPEKHQPIEIPEPLKSALLKNKTLQQAFAQLSSGRQKEYSLYIIEAKQENTKLTRIEKIKPLILQGIGLNDKYKK